ncbi:hypothetical protein OE88DRAFT_1661482 [Heliocybe sulcata]|uniref:C2H2-type domain-containing protein n=1 Tax=Heliocybe sulcata TaxID=5364 RepID=A0A5C3N868_9AGAM|nr:hypothetical protein OE88DRAFT_1661482 [Heliocybe sulcata]
MSHTFPLEQLAQHKLCMDFSMPGKPPSIEWVALSRAIHLDSVDSGLLSLRANVSCANGKNILTLFLIEDREAMEAEFHARGGSSSTSASLLFHKPEIRDTSSGCRDQVQSATPSTVMSLCHEETVIPTDNLGSSIPASRKGNLLQQAAYNCSSRHSSRFASPAMPTNTPLPTPDGLHTPPPVPSRLDWIPSSDPSQDWQRFVGAFGWSGQDTYQRQSETPFLGPISPYPRAPPDSIYEGEQQAPLHTGAMWLSKEESILAASSSTSSPSYDLSPYAHSSSTPVGSVSVSSTSNDATTSGIAFFTPQASNPLPTSSSVHSESDYFPATDGELDHCVSSAPPARSLSRDGDTRTNSAASPRFHCKQDGCSRSFRNAHTLSVHSASHRKTAKKRFECPTCSETFSRRHDMMRHEVSQHGKVPDWTCERCRRFFSSEMMFKNHKCPAVHRPTKLSLGGRETTSFYC